jgi:hypothetical protein
MRAMASWFRRRGVWCRAGLTAGIALTLVVAGCGSPTRSSVGSSIANSTTTTTKVTTTSTTPSAPLVLLSRSGSGSVTTNLFTVPSGAPGWDLTWSYTCEHKPSSIFSFVAVVYDGSKTDTRDKAVTGSEASGQGTEHYTDAGSFTLHVDGYPGICTWTVKATTPGG